MPREKESTRQLKVAGQVQKDIAEIIRSRGMSFWKGALVSVSGVKMSPDLAVAKVYVSIFPSDKSDDVMKLLEENSRALRGALGSKTGHQLRIVPQLSFCIDSSMDYVEHIDELLKK